MKAYIVRDGYGDERVFKANSDYTVVEITTGQQYPVLPGRVQRTINIEKKELWSPERLRAWQKTGVVVTGTQLGYYFIEPSRTARVWNFIKNCFKFLIS